MNTIEILKQKLAKNINDILGQVLVGADEFNYPVNQEFGDLSLPLFVLAKKTGVPIGELASKIIAGFGDNEIFSSVKSAGAYLNFTINTSYIAKSVLAEIDSQSIEYGKNDSGKGEKVMVEYSNVNTHKEYHVGHLRNLCFGDSVSRILAVNGAEVKPISYINDFGIHVAKTIWGLEEYYKDEKLPENKGRFLGQVYARVSKELEGNQVAKSLVGLIMSKIESRQGEEYELWQKTRQWSIEQHSHIYKEMAVLLNNDETLYESDYVDEGRRQVDSLIEKGVLIHSQGAVIADLEDDKLGVLMFLRSDGTALYPVADLELAKAKFDKFGLTKSIYVIDIRQSQYFKQLFLILKKMGYDQEMVHLGYDFVKLPDGMMSSRTGNIITYDELKEEAMSRAKSEIKSRHQDWSDEKIDRIAWEIVLGAIKFEMLKVGADQVITFDYDAALRFDGFTSAYIQYSGVRIGSIIKKAGEAGKDADLRLLADSREHAILLSLARFPEAVREAGERYDPSEIAKYLFSLAKEFNEYYHAVPVIGSEEAVRQARLKLLAGIRQTMENGLRLLGIGIPEEM